MTRYTYKCDSCENVIETDHGMMETPLVMCPQCESAFPMFRLITGGTGVIFKGNTGMRVGGTREGSWDWGVKRPSALDGHKISKEERRHIEAKQIKKYMDKAKGVVADPQKLAAAIDKKAKKIVT